MIHQHDSPCFLNPMIELAVRKGLKVTHMHVGSNVEPMSKARLATVGLEHDTQA